MIKRLFRAFLMCQSMFVSIPCPKFNWDESARPLMIAFLPVIGLELGLISFAAAYVCLALSAPPSIFALALSALPIVLTGGIHLDGFLDVSDAILSCRTIEKRRQILKDPHVGSFAVIACALYFLTMFASLSTTPTFEPIILIFIPVLSRACSAIAVSLVKPIPQSQFAPSFSPNLRRAIVPISAILLTFIVILAFAPPNPLRLTAALLAELAVYALSAWRAVRSLGGMNGDISGFSISLSELAAVFVCAVV